MTDPSGDRCSDEQAALVRRATAGDAAALQQLLLLHRKPLLAYVERRLPPELRRAVEANDVLQDVWFEVFRAVARFTPDAPDAFAPWLFTIARHKLVNLLDAHRTQKRGAGRTPVDLSDGPVELLLEELAVYDRTPSGSAAGHELLERVERSIRRLPPDVAEAVTLRHLRGLAVGEVAVLMGCSQDVVRQRCSRGLRALREEMGSVSLYV